MVRVDGPLVGCLCTGHVTLHGQQMAERNACTSGLVRIVRTDDRFEQKASSVRVALVDQQDGAVGLGEWDDLRVLRGERCFQQQTGAVNVTPDGEKSTEARLGEWDGLRVLRGERCFQQRAGAVSTSPWLIS